MKIKKKTILEAAAIVDTVLNDRHQVLLHALALVEIDRGILSHFEEMKEMSDEERRRKSDEWNENEGALVNALKQELWLHKETGREQKLRIEQFCDKFPEISKSTHEEFERTEKSEASLNFDELNPNLNPPAEKPSEASLNFDDLNPRKQ